MKVSIAPDFEHLLPALADAELSQLEENCKADPAHERMPPVVIWSNQKNTIIDGHNQHRIREKLRLKIKYAKLEFETRDEAYQYALDVQFGRRNLSASQRAIAYAKLPRKTVGKPSANGAKLRSIEELAQKASVSPRTMDDAVKVVDTAPAKVVKDVEAGKKSVSAAVKESRESAKEKAKRQWGDGDSLEDVQADLKELARRCKEVSKFARMIVGWEGDAPTRPYCGNYSLTTISHPLLHTARVVGNDMPVGGTPKKPILFHEEKAAALAK